MANYGRGWGNGTPEEQAKYDDETAMREGDWDWLDRSPRQRRLRQEQGLNSSDYATEADQ